MRKTKKPERALELFLLRKAKEIQVERGVTSYTMDKATIYFKEGRFGEIIVVDKHDNNPEIIIKNTIFDSAYDERVKSLHLNLKTNCAKSTTKPTYMVMYRYNLILGKEGYSFKMNEFPVYRDRDRYYSIYNNSIKRRTQTQTVFKKTFDVLKGGANNFVLYTFDNTLKQSFLNDCIKYLEDRIDFHQELFKLNKINNLGYYKKCYSILEDFLREKTEEKTVYSTYAIYKNGEYIGDLEAATEKDAISKCFNGAFGFANSDDMFEADIIEKEVK